MATSVVMCYPAGPFEIRRRLCTSIAGDWALPVVTSCCCRLQCVRQLVSNRCAKHKTTAVPIYWVLVKGFTLSYHTKETFLFTIDLHYGNLL